MFDFLGRVAIVTGAGAGDVLGRCHALGLTSRGAQVVVNDTGTGAQAETRITETIGALLPGDITPEAVAAHWEEITDPAGAGNLENAFAQTRKYAGRAARTKAVTLD